MASSPDPINLHASAVAIEGQGVLILGASGSGKSALALHLMGMGAQLIADDRVDLRRDGSQIIASCPATLRGRIEARGIGLLHATPAPRAALALVVDLDQTEAARLPQRRETMLHGRNIPLLHKAAHPYFPAAILQYVKGGRRDPET